MCKNPSKKQRSNPVIYKSTIVGIMLPYIRETEQLQNCDDRMIMKRVVFA